MTNWTIDGMKHKKIKMVEFTIKLPFSQTPRIQNISKNHNLYPHQREITLPGLLWDTLYLIIKTFNWSCSYVICWSNTIVNVFFCTYRVKPLIRLTSITNNRDFQLSMSFNNIACTQYTVLPLLFCILLSNHFDL